MPDAALEILDFRGGQDTTSARGRCDLQRPRRLRNCACNEAGRLEIMPGHGLKRAVPGVSSVYRFSDATDSYLVYVVGTNVYAWNEDGLSAPLAIGNCDVADPCFQQWNDRLFWSSYSNQVQQWTPTAGAALAAGLRAPTYVPVIADGGSAGGLNSTGKPVDKYDIVYTLVSSLGEESNPSPVSNAIALNNRSATYTVMRDAALPTPEILKTTHVRFYRRGGVVSDFYFVAEVAITPDTGVYPNTLATYTDTLRDVELSTVLVPRNNDRPRANVDLIQLHGDRMFAASTGSIRLDFSGVSKPYSFGSYPDTQAFDGGYMTLPGGLKDTIRTMSSTGSLLVVGRRGSVWALFGNRWDQFGWSQRSNVGVASRWGMCRVVNEVWYAGTDRQIRKLTEGGAEIVSQDIYRSLRSVPDADWSACRLAFAGTRVVLSFPTSGAVAYIYNILSGGWEEDDELASTWIVGDVSNDTPTDEFLFIPTAGGEVRRAFSDTVNKRKFSYLSAEKIRTPAQGPLTARGAWRAESITVEGTLTAGATPPTVTVYAGTKSDERALSNVDDGVMIDTRLVQNLDAIDIQVGIEGRTYPGDEITLVSVNLSEVTVTGRAR